MTDKNKIQIGALVIFIFAVVVVLFLNEQKKLDGKAEIEKQVNQDFKNNKPEFTAWANFFLNQNTLPSEWSLENRDRGGLWFHDESPHDGLINLFTPNIVLPENLEEKLKRYNISNIYCIKDTAGTRIEFVYANNYITSPQERSLRLIYSPNDNNISNKKITTLNWQTAIEPHWILESRVD